MRFLTTRCKCTNRANCTFFSKRLVPFTKGYLPFCIHLLSFCFSFWPFECSRRERFHRPLILRFCQFSTKYICLYRFVSLKSSELFVLEESWPRGFTFYVCRVSRDVVIVSIFFKYLLPEVCYTAANRRADEKKKCKYCWTRGLYRVFSSDP